MDETTSTIQTIPKVCESIGNMNSGEIRADSGTQTTTEMARVHQERRGGGMGRTEIHQGRQRHIQGGGLGEQAQGESILLGRGRGESCRPIQAHQPNESEIRQDRRLGQDSSDQRPRRDDERSEQEMELGKEIENAGTPRGDRNGQRRNSSRQWYTDNH